MDTTFEVLNGKTEYSILHEIKTFSSLIEKRDAWLNKPENKMKGTYKAVKLDTDDMKVKLSALREELAEVQNATK